MSFDPSRFPVLAARAEEQRELTALRKAQPPVRTARVQPDFAVQVLNVVQTVAQALCDYRPLRIALANLGDAGGAASGFEYESQGEFKNPFILISKMDFRRKAVHPYFLDAYAGFACHETAHLHHSRLTLTAIAKKKHSPMALYINVWEDDRIERKLQQEHPATIPYIEAARQLFLVTDIRRQFLVEWQNLDEIDRYQTLLFGFVRSPATVVKINHGWIDATGENPLDDFEKWFPKNPDTEKDVLLYAKRTKRLVDRFRAKYPSNARELARWLQKKRPVLLDTSRIAEQLFRDIMNSFHTEKHSDSNKRSFFVEHEIDRLKEIVPTVEAGKFRKELDDVVSRIEDIVTKSSRPEKLPPSLRNAIDKHAKAIREKMLRKHIPLPKQNVFEQLIKGSQGIISRGFNNSEIKSITEGFRLHFSGNLFEFDEFQVPVVGVVSSHNAVHVYENSLRKQMEEIRALQSYIRKLSRDDKPDMSYQRRNGTLDPRQVARGTFSERIFRTKIEKQEIPVREIVLLLDQSGSIYGEARTVFNSAVLLVEAFRGIRGYQTVIYSHSTSEECRGPIVYHYGHNNIREALPEYVLEHDRFKGNIDNVAIQAVAAAREKTTGAMRKRLLVVISDGEPCGYNAVERTRDVVEELRRKYWRVVNIAVGTGDNFDDIYGKEHTARSSFKGLAHNLGRIVYRELQGFY